MLFRTLSAAVYGIGCRSRSILKLNLTPVRGEADSPCRNDCWIT